MLPRLFSRRQGLYREQAVPWGVQGAAFLPSGAPGPVLFRALRRLVSALLSLIVVLLPCFAPM